MSGQIDLLAVFIAAILNMVIAYAWYSPWLFGNLWMRHNKGAMHKERQFALLWSALISLVTAYILAFFEAILSVTTVSDGMFVGFFVWLGFVATTQVSKVIWSGTPLKVFLLETAQKLLSYLVMGGILGA